MTPPAYDGKVVAITGARKGLGRAIALHFLAHGARVLGLGRGPGSIEHPAYRHYLCDVRDAQAVRATFQEVGRAEAGGLHVLINNSAVLTSQHSMLLPATRRR